MAGDKLKTADPFPIACSKVPRINYFWAFLQGHMITQRLSVTCAYHYNLRARVKPFFEVRFVCTASNTPSKKTYFRSFSVLIPSLLRTRRHIFTQHKRTKLLSEDDCMLTIFLLVSWFPLFFSWNCLNQEWVFQVDLSHKREKIKRGLYPGDENDIPIQAPLEMFNVAGASFTDPVFSFLFIIDVLWRFVTMPLKIADFSLPCLGAASRPPDLPPTLSNSSRKIRSHRNQGRCNVHEVKGLAACPQRS